MRTEGQLQFQWTTALTLLSRFVGLVFLVAGAAKIRDPYAFLGVVYDYELFSVVYGLLVAAILPWLEFVIGALLIADIWRSIVMRLALVLSLIFALVQISAIVRGLDIACGCFGTGASVGFRTVAMSSLLAAAAGVVICYNTSLESSALPTHSESSSVNRTRIPT